MSTPVAAHILIANDLMSGETLFMGKKGWVADHRASRIARDAAEAEALAALGMQEMQKNRVVDAYIVPVTLESDGTPVPIHYREKMRTKGPSNRPDLGKQAAGHQL